MKPASIDNLDDDESDRSSNRMHRVVEGLKHDAFNVIEVGVWNVFKVAIDQGFERKSWRSGKFVKKSDVDYPRFA